VMFWATYGIVAPVQIVCMFSYTSLVKFLWCKQASPPLSSLKWTYRDWKHNFSLIF
jgi:hypothetical protein